MFFSLIVTFIRNLYEVITGRHHLDPELKPPFAPKTPQATSSEKAGQKEVQILAVAADVSAPAAPNVVTVRCRNCGYYSPRDSGECSHCHQPLERR